MCVRGGWLTNKERRKRGEQGGVAVRWIPSVALVFMLFLKGAVRGGAVREDLRGWMMVWGSWGGGQ